MSMVEDVIFQGWFSIIISVLADNADSLEDDDAGLENVPLDSESE